MSKRIRPVAICVIRHNNKILVFEGEDPVKGETFYRPLGGSVEFGEYSHQAVAREFLEEINAEITDIKLLDTLENIFNYRGEQLHEIIFVYEGKLADNSIYEKESFTGYEDDGSSFKTLWMPLDYFVNKKAPLYPTGLLELLLKTV